MDALKMANEAAAKARKDLVLAEQRLADEESRLNEARAAALKASVECRNANPDHSSFEKTVGERAHAHARVGAFAQRCSNARVEVEAAKKLARDASIASLEAELKQLDREIAGDDAALLQATLELIRDARKRLRQIHERIQRADACEQAIAVARGENLNASWRWPVLTRSYWGGVVNPLSDERILGNLENAALDEIHAWNRNKRSLLMAVRADVASGKAS